MLSKFGYSPSFKNPNSWSPAMLRSLGQPKYSPFPPQVHLVTAGHSTKSSSCDCLCSRWEDWSGTERLSQTLGCENTSGWQRCKREDCLAQKKKSTNAFQSSFTHCNHTVYLRELLELKTRGLSELNLSCVRALQSQQSGVRDWSALLKPEKVTNPFTICTLLACLLKCRVISLNEEQNGMTVEAALKPHSHIALV